VTGPLGLGHDNFIYVFLPAFFALIPLAMDRAAALIVAAGLMLLFTFLEILTIGVYYLPAAGAMSTAALLRSSGSDLDVSTEAEALMATLRERGAAASAEKLDHAIIGGATGTEILVRLHEALGDLLSAGELPDRETRRRARDLRRVITMRLRV
jgi:hypothetical protein